jgi:hypothetical protein
VVWVTRRRPSGSLPISRGALAGQARSVARRAAAGSLSGVQEPRFCFFFGATSEPDVELSRFRLAPCFFFALRGASGR